MLAGMGKVVIMGLAFGAAAANPLNFREYQQDFTLTFADEAAAKAAQVAVCPLYGNAKVALSARWDDTNPAGHANTLSVMKRHGLKGTFFYNSVTKTGAVAFAKEAQKAGCTIGLHTDTHPQLGGCHANKIFAEYLLNRIRIEDAVNAPAVAQVVPYGYHSCLNRDYPGDLSRTLQAVGVIATPEFSPDFGKKIGYPEHALAESFLLQSGDREPEPDRLAKCWQKVKTSPLFPGDVPALTAAVHSWHTPEGLKALDALFSEMDKQPDAWKCNQNEYGSYRYEYRFSRLKVTREGRRLLCSVTRICPEELGAEVPLCFSVKGAVPVQAGGATLQDALVLLPHAAGRKLPSVYALAGPDGASPRFPGMKALLRRNASGAVSLALENGGKSDCSDVDVTFYLPPAYETMTCRMERRLLAAGAKAQIPIPAGKRSGDPRFRYGEQLWAARIDFTRDGVRNRLYAVFADADLPLRLTDAARTFLLPRENYDWEKLSKVGTVLNLPDAKLFEHWDEGAAPGYLSLFFPRPEEKIPMACFVEIAAPTDRPLTLKTNAERLFVNGEEIKLERERATVAAPQAHNRVVMLFRHSRYRQNFLILKGEECRYLVPEEWE